MTAPPGPPGPKCATCPGDNWFVDFLTVSGGRCPKCKGVEVGVPDVHVDYSQVGHAKSFTVPMFYYRRDELISGTVVRLVGDGVEDQIGVISYWTEDNQVRIDVLEA